MPLTPEFHNEILECLRRSGYLLESRLVRSLAEFGFFIQPNVAVVDRRTGKSREIDLVAEYFEYEPSRSIGTTHVHVRTEFAIEAINNSLPLVLMTPHPSSPDFDLVETLRYGTTPPSPNEFEVEIDIYDAKRLGKSVRYSQYCALTRKKSGDELMASHPDDLYSTFLKLAEFVEQKASEFQSHEWSTDDEYWRLVFWQAVLVVGGDLLVVTEDENSQLSLSEVDRASLIFNFHATDRPRSVAIEIVRERELLRFLRAVVDDDYRLAERMYDLRASLDPAK